MSPRKLKSKQTVDLFSSALAGNADAQYEIGSSFESAKGLPKNDSEALRWYRKAAENGHPQAQYWMGAFCDSGVVSDKKPEEAARWYRKAAEQGHANAQYCLGVCFANGVGVLKNNGEAVEWFREAAEKGHPEAKNQLKILKAVESTYPKTAARERSHVHADGHISKSESVSKQSEKPKPSGMTHFVLEKIFGHSQWWEKAIWGAVALAIAAVLLFEFGVIVLFVIGCAPLLLLFLPHHRAGRARTKKLPSRGRFQ